MADAALLPQRLRGKSQWLMGPSNLSAVLAGLMAPYYAWLTIEFPGRAGLHYAVLGVLCIGMSTPVGVSIAQRQLRTLRALASGKLAGTREELARAVGEVARIADHGMRMSLYSWGGIPLISGLALKLISPEPVSWLLVLRIALMGLIFGPLASVLMYYLTTLRARVLVTELAQLGGLDTRAVAQVIPVRRAGLRLRFAVSTAMAFVTPCWLAADVSLTLAHARWARLLAQANPSAQRALTMADSSTLFPLLVLVGASVALALWTAAVAGLSLGEPLQAIASEATKIAAGELDEGPVVLAEDEAWVVSASFAAMRAYLVDVISELRRAGVQVSSSSQALLYTSAIQEEGTVRQASALNQTSATTAVLAQSAEQTAQTALSVSELAARTLSTASAGQEQVQTFLSAVAQIRSDNDAIANAVETLKGKVQQIGRIVEFIRELADKSDLLAVNAELEGTKAGEVGRGFSLVATELRRLAESVLAATQEIEQRIDDIRGSTQDAVEATQVSVRATEIGAELAVEMSESFRKVLQLADQTSDAIRSISLATQQQQQGAAQLAEAMADILGGTQEASSVTRQMSAASHGLAGLSQALDEAVRRFRIAAEREAAVASPEVSP